MSNALAQAPTGKDQRRLSRKGTPDNVISGTAYERLKASVLKTGGALPYADEESFLADQDACRVHAQQSHTAFLADCGARAEPVEQSLRDYDSFEDHMGLPATVNHTLQPIITEYGATLNNLQWSLPSAMSASRESSAAVHYEVRVDGTGRHREPDENPLARGLVLKDELES